MNTIESNIYSDIFSQPDSMIKLICSFPQIRGPLVHTVPSSLRSASFSISNCSMRAERLSICSSAPALNSSMILNTRHKRRITMIEPASSSTPFRQTSTTNPARMTAASKQWNLEWKNLSPLLVWMYMYRSSVGLLQAKGPYTSDQFSHKKAAEYEAHNS